MMRTQKPHALKPNDSKCFKIKVMFLQNRNQPILTEFRGCFPHAVDM